MALCVYIFLPRIVSNLQLIIKGALSWRCGIYSALATIHNYEVLVRCYTCASAPIAVLVLL